MLNISDEIQVIKDNIKFLTFEGSYNDKSFLVKDSDRYTNYVEKINNNELVINDILTIKDIFKICDLDLKEDKVKSLEKMFIDIFAAKNKGSLTTDWKDEYNFSPLDFPKIFSTISMGEYKPVWVSDNLEKPDFVGFQKYISAANNLKDKLCAFIEKNISGFPIDIQKYKDAFNEAMKVVSMEPCPEQKVAVVNSMVNKAFSIITGGPGTGKTTVVFSLLVSLIKLSELNNDKLTPQDVVLLAPTGRAAGRIGDQIKAQSENKKQDVGFDFSLLEGMTIHRFLGKIKNKKYICPKLVIVDEVSMVDICLMSDLINFLDPEKTKLILVGDYNQLPSVEAGCVMADLSNNNEYSNVISNYESTKYIKCIKDIISDDIFDLENSKGLKTELPCTFKSNLNCNHRANVDSLKDAFNLIMSVKGTNNDFLPNHINDPRVEFINLHNDMFANRNDINDFLKKAYLEKDDVLNKSYVKFVNDFCENIDFTKTDSYMDDLERIFSHLNKYKVLCPMKRGSLGCESINKMFLKEYGKEVKNQNNVFFNGMGIMITRNDYGKGIFNGDVGVVLRDKTGNCKAIFKTSENGKIVYKSFSVLSLEYYDYAFAMTIHKSQGSEYDNVLIPIDEDNELLTNELLYTAVTRAKESFILFGNETVINEMCKRKIKRENKISLL